MWNFCAVMGCLNYLQGMTQLDLSYSVHQCAWFCNSPKLSHKQALKRICCYLCGTRHKGLIFKPDLKQGFKCYVDADWARNWLKSNPSSPDGILSRSSFLIKYANCPILWGSKMQITCRFKYHRDRNYCPVHSFAQSHPPTESPTRTRGPTRSPYHSLRHKFIVIPLKIMLLCIEVATSKGQNSPKDQAPCHLLVSFSRSY